MRRAATLFVVLVVGAYYSWGVRATGKGFEWGHDLGGYYNYLARGFSSGHLYVPLQPSKELLAVPDPWDPAVNGSYKMGDMALFKGHYYLYFGAAPAVLLFLPWRVLTRHDLPENFALFLLCLGGFLFACGTLLRIFALAGVRVGIPLLGAMLLALGICQGIPFLLNRVFVYEIAIGGGYFFVSGALFFLVHGIGSRRSGYWLAASGLMSGLALASRPHLALMGLMVLLSLVAPLIYMRASVDSARKRFYIRQKLAPFLATFMLVGAAVAIYNYERFENPFEFGFRYQLSGPGQNRIDLSIRNLIPGSYYMLLTPPVFRPVFPWVRMALRLPFNSPRFSPPPDYFLEPTIGALWMAPFAIGAVLIPRGLPQLAEVQTVLRAVTVSAVAIVAFLVATHLATQRYEVDFLPIAVLAALANIGIHSSRIAGPNRLAISVPLVSCVGYSAIVNLALGIAGPYDDMLRYRPGEYVRIARAFSPIPEFRPILNPDIALEFTAEFPHYATGAREPLIAIGQQGNRYSLAVEGAPGALTLVSQTNNATLKHTLPDPGRTPMKFRLTYSPVERNLITTVNGELVFIHPIDILVTAPAQVLAGFDPVEPDWSSRFSGHIQVVEKIVREAGGTI